MKFTEDQLATVLSALRFWQTWMMNNDGETPIADHFSDGAIPLTVGEIDELCEELNCG